MQTKAVPAKVPDYSGLAWRPKELHEKLTAQKNDPRVSVAFLTGAKILERQIAGVLRKYRGNTSTTQP
jgi:hypothetical protein